jgi:hypothetical protein
MPTLTRVLNDPRATAVCSGGRDSGHEMTKKVLDSRVDAKGQVIEIGRGVTDTDITYIALYNSTGVKTYIYPDAAGTAITVTPTKP